MKTVYMIFLIVVVILALMTASLFQPLDEAVLDSLKVQYCHQEGLVPEEWHWQQDKCFPGVYHLVNKQGERYAQVHRQ